MLTDRLKRHRTTELFNQSIDLPILSLIQQSSFIFGGKSKNHTCSNEAYEICTLFFFFKKKSLLYVSVINEIITIVIACCLQLLVSHCM